MPDTTQHESSKAAALHVGVVGCGYWGARHVRVFSAIENVSVIAIDADAALARAAAWPYRARWASSLESVVDELDAVVIATPPGSHFALAAQALDADCHVLVEKPLTTTIADGQALVNEAKQRNRVLMAGHTFLANDAVRALRDIVSAESFGAIRYLDSARLNLGLYQRDVNVVWDLAPHDISIFNYLTGECPMEVGAWVAGASGELAESAYLRLHYGSGVVGTIHVSWLDPSRVRRTSVVGQKQMAIYDDAAENRLTILDRSSQEIDGQRQYVRGDIKLPALDFREPLQVQAHEFIDAITMGTPVPADGVSGLDVVRVLRAADLAMMTNQMVKVDERFDPDEFDDEAVLDLTLREVRR